MKNHSSSTKQSSINSNEDDPQPSSHNSHGAFSGAILAAFIANVGIAISKLAAFAMTGATSMLAEAVHSLADCSNQILLYLGSRKANKTPTRTHPFGYGRAHFLYAFMVSIVLFSLGGAFAIYEGIEKINHPHMIESPVIAYVVLGIAMLLEGFALRTALREAKHFKPKQQNWWEFLKRTKSVNHIVLALEDSAALVGLSIAALGITLTIVTQNPVWDGIASLLIGVLLVVVASILFREVQSLLIGESANAATERKIRKLTLTVDTVNQVVDLKTLYTGPSELFIAMKITVDGSHSAKAVARAIDEIEARLRRELPIARLIYIEPDTYKSKVEQRAADKVIEETISPK